MSVTCERELEYILDAAGDTPGDPEWVRCLDPACDYTWQIDDPVGRFCPECGGESEVEV